MAFSLPPRGVEVVLIAIIIAAAVYDVRYRRIPNWLTVTGVLLGLAVNFFIRMEEPPYKGWLGLVDSLKGLGMGFGVYFILYALRAMGAGDVKLMAAVGALVGWQNWFGIFLVTAVFGGALTIVFASLKKRLKTTFWNVGFILSEMKSGRPAYLTKEELDVKNPKAVGLPHGAVIAVGTLIFLAAAAHYAG